MVWRWVVVAGVLLGAAGSARAEDGPDLEAALARAKAEGKPVLLEFTADWCKPCERFEREVLSDSGVRGHLDEVVFVRCDIETKRGEAIEETYGATGVPSFLVLDGDGVELHRERGYQDKQDFLALVALAERLAVPEPAEVPDDPQALHEAADWYVVRGRTAEALELLERAIGADPKNEAGIGAMAAWKATELTGRIARRKVAVAEAIEHVEAFPGTATATKAVARAALSGELAPARVESLLRRHVEALDPEASDPDDLRYLLYAALAAEQPALAAAVAQTLEPLATEAKHYFGIAEAYGRAGDEARMREAVDECAKHASTPAERVACASLARRMAAGDTTSRGATVVQRDIDRYFVNLTQPGHSGDTERSAIDRDMRSARLTGGQQRELERHRHFMETARDNLDEAGRACAEHRGQLREAWVRVQLTHANEPPARVTVLEPDAGDGLRRCLRDSLGGAEFPAAPRYMDGRYVGRVRLDSTDRKRRRGELDMPRGELRREWLLVGRHGHGLYEDTSVLARLFVPLSKREVGVRPALLFDGTIGRASGATGYGGSAMIGAATATYPAQLGLFIGGAAGRTGDDVPFAWQLPLELSVSIDSPTVRMRAWARLSWVTGDARQGGSETAPNNADELDLGVGYTLPASTKRGLFFGLYYREVVGERVGGVMLGTTNARLY